MILFGKAEEKYKYSRKWSYIQLRRPTLALGKRPKWMTLNELTSSRLKYIQKKNKKTKSEVAAISPSKWIN